MLLAGCASRGPSNRPSSWDASYFPLATGNLWIYQEAIRRGGQETEKLRLKEAIPHRDGIWALHDVDGDDYLFSSTADALRLHGEVKPGGTEVVFEPPLEYVNANLLREGREARVHQADSRTLRTRAEIVGLRRTRVPAVPGEVECLVTRFEYVTSDDKRFSIENWFVRGIGPIVRAFSLQDSTGREVLSTRLTLVAARVDGMIFPSDDPSVLAKNGFQHAFDHRDVWDASFPGFTAKVRLKVDGRNAGEYRLDVGRGGLGHELVPVGQDSEDAAWLQRTVESMLDHRRARKFDEQHRGAAFKLADAPSAVIGIDLEGDAMGSRYEVRGGVVQTVSRLDEGRRRFKIVVKNVRWSTSGRYLPTRFDVMLYDGGMNVRETREVTDEFLDIDGYRIPSHRHVRTGGKVFELWIEDIRLK